MYSWEGSKLVCKWGSRATDQKLLDWHFAKSFFVDFFEGLHNRLSEAKDVGVWGPGVQDVWLCN